MKGSFPGAEAYIPPTRDLRRLTEAADGCRGCPLFADTTQAVFGEGSKECEIMLIGEQPGDKEDLQGRPFIGPAGKLLDKALIEAEVDRRRVYLTNAVKHFKHRTTSTGRRLHSKPNRKETEACWPWLAREIEVVRPHRIGCMGATAAQQMLGRDFKITRDGGVPIRDGRFAEVVVAMLHPSAVLRMRTHEDRHQAFDQLVSALRVLASADLT